MFFFPNTTLYFICRSCTDTLSLTQALIAAHLHFSNYCYYEPFIFFNYKINRGKREETGRNIFSPAMYITPKYKFPFNVKPDQQRKRCEGIAVEVLLIFPNVIRWDF